MQITLTIINKKDKLKNLKILSSLNKILDDDIEIKVGHKELTYEKIQNHFLLKSEIIKFVSSTDNRRLFFNFQDVYGTTYGIEPYKNIDGSKREKYKGQKIKLGKDIIYEGDLFVNYFKNNWDSKKWNICDTKEDVCWSFANFIDIYLKPNEKFKIKFVILK